MTNGVFLIAEASSRVAPGARGVGGKETAKGGGGGSPVSSPPPLRPLPCSSNPVLAFLGFAF